MLVQNQALQKELAGLKAASAKESASLRQSVVKAKEKISEEDRKSSTLTAMNKSAQGDLLSAQDELQTLKDELRRAKGKIASQKTKITKMESENDMFRKFYSRNMADKR